MFPQIQAYTKLSRSQENKVLDKIKSLFHLIAFPVITAIGLAGLFYAFAWLARTDIHADPPEHDSEEVAAVESDRDVSFDPDDTPVLHQEVDYSEGEEGGLVSERRIADPGRTGGRGKIAAGRGTGRS